MKAFLILLVALSINGCYTVLKSSGNYYSEFSSNNSEESGSVETDTTEENAPEPEPKDIIINNYYADDYWASPWYVSPWGHYRYGYYPYGWSWSVGYGWYDPWYDPYYNYNGWCYYPTTPCYDPLPGYSSSTDRQRLYGQRYNVTGRTPNLLATVSGSSAAYPKRLYRIRKPASETREENQKREYSASSENRENKTQNRSDRSGNGRDRSYRTESRTEKNSSGTNGRSAGRESRATSRSSGNSGGRTERKSRN